MLFPLNIEYAKKLAEDKLTHKYKKYMHQIELDGMHICFKRWKTDQTIDFILEPVKGVIISGSKEEQEHIKKNIVHYILRDIIHHIINAYKNDLIKELANIK